MNCSTQSARTQSQVAFRYLVILAFLAALLLGALRAAGQTAPPSEARPSAQPARRIVVSIPDRKLGLLEGDSVVKVYDVAVGATVSPSPSGEFQIVQRLENLGYYHPGVVVAPGKSNPLGTRWIGLNVKGFGIHGTNRPSSIGKSAAHGCIRLRNADIEDLFARVKVGDRVSLISQRNDEVARVLGGEPSFGNTHETLQAENEPAGSPDNGAQGDR